MGNENTKLWHYDATGQMVSSREVIDHQGPIEEKREAIKFSTEKKLEEAPPPAPKPLSRSRAHSDLPSAVEAELKNKH